MELILRWLPLERGGPLAQRLREMLPKDARIYQILFLGTLFCVGVLARDFTLRWEQMALTFIAGITTQAYAMRHLGLKRGYLSAVVTCFGLSILLRADSLWVHPLIAALAIGSKFVLRFNGKHVYNPANLGVICGLTLLPGAWISPGQWGHDLAVAVWFVVLGAIVTSKARRWDISWIFITLFLGMVLVRVLWLGQNPAVFWHQLGNGALLLFTFFMISDPMTIPNHRYARFAYAAIVASVAIFWQYGLFKPNALVWSLFFCTPLVPLLDRLLPAQKFDWKTPNDTPPHDMRRALEPHITR